jgi:hypothetical protein
MHGPQRQGVISSVILYGAIDVFDKSGIEEAPLVMTNNLKVRGSCSVGTQNIVGETLSSCMSRHRGAHITDSGDVMTSTPDL